MLVRTQNRNSIGKIKSYSHRKWHYTFAKMTPRSKQNQWLISREPARSVEDGFDVAPELIQGELGLALGLSDTTLGSPETAV